MFYLKKHVMENQVKSSVNKGLAKVWQVCLLSVLFVSSLVARAAAQESGPSTENIKNNLSALSKAQAKQQHDEFMSYIYMGVGFAIVIAIAWTTTVMARKRSRRQNEERQRYILRQQELKKHGHGHIHGHAKVRR